MKITEIVAHVLGDTMLVAVHTDAGLTGVGESVCWAYPEAAGQVARKFGRYLVGKDPNLIEHHWHMMWRMGAFRGSVIAGAVSAIDVALWDIKGQRLAVPVHDLLGGPYRKRIRLHQMIGGADAAELGRAARQAADEGFTAVKYGVRVGVDDTLQQMISTAVEDATAIRDETSGRVDMIAEVHRGMTPHQIPALLDALRPFRPLYVEDPIQIDTIDVQARLTTLGVPLGLGERWQSLWEVREALAANGPFVVRADVNLSGGITAGRKIAAVAEANHAQVSWHNYLTPVSDASTLTIDAVVPNLLTHEHGGVAMLRRLGNAVQSDWVVDSGHMVVPSTPGLGIRVDFDALPERADVLGRELFEIPLRADGSVAFAF